MVDDCGVVTTSMISRRAFLGALVGAAGAAGLGACSRPASVSARDVATTESRRAASGAVRDVRLRARVVDLDLGGQRVSTWAYGDSVPGAVIRVTAGDRVQVNFTNDLPVETSVHWHGLAIRNDMDGVPGVTTPAIAAGGQFDYDFLVPDAGTHWFHPHSGLQLDTGLYAPFIVDDPREPGGYDTEWVLVLDDWTDGVGPSADQIYQGLLADGGDAADSGMSMDHGDGMGMADGGDVAYPMFLINGRPPSDPDVLRAKTGDRVRLRIINAGADTTFTVALGGHRMTVTHTDGYPVQPLRTSALRIGMGERYDALITAGEGTFPLVAEPVGKSGYARALVRTAAVRRNESPRPSELNSYPTGVSDLRVTPDAGLAKRSPDSVQDVVLSGSMSPYVWTINGDTYDNARPLTVRQGELLRLRLVNMSMMSHPVHLHGHSFQLGGAGGSGPRKDTVLLPPMGAAEVDVEADNPGQWMLHCHNAYHAEAGMMTRLEYTT